MGIPVLTMELAVGRAGRGSAGTAYRALEPKGSKWHWHGWACLAGCCLLMMYYTTVNGWMMDYCFKYIVGAFAGATPETAGNAFDQMLANPWEMGFWTVLTVVLGLVVTSFGLNNGLERVGKWMMSALILLILVLVVHSLTLPGAGEGLAFYLLPSMERASEIGLGTVIMNAMNQSFFTLSLGIGAMEIFAAIWSASTPCPARRPASACWTPLWPSARVSSSSRPASPSASAGQRPPADLHYPAQRLCRAGRRPAVGVAVLPVHDLRQLHHRHCGVENIIACLMEQFCLSRRKAVLIGGVFLLAASLPCVLGYNVWSGFQPLGAGSTVLDGEDFLVSNLLLPVGSLIYLLFCVSRWGWGFDKYLAEANSAAALACPAGSSPTSSSCCGADRGDPAAGAAVKRKGLPRFVTMKQQNSGTESPLLVRQEYPNLLEQA